ncbi:MAG: hypothetical protein IJ439_01735 [Tyzzerella sp.]|nr:hypothetical protein [Tyzzerella sp.]
MSGKIEFLEKLNGLLKMAQAQGSQITIDEVKAYFSEDALTEEQMELVFDYLLTQKVAVKGYVKINSTEKEEEFSEEEKAYLKEYETDLGAFREISEEERREMYGQAATGNEAAKQKLIESYLREVVKIAKEMHKPEVFLGDLIQEGNLGLVLGVEILSAVDASTAHEIITQQIRQSIQLLLEEQAELTSRDKKMVEKVQALDESIQALTEELGRKVTIDELAIYMGMEIEEIEDILKLTGEEPEAEEN